MRALHYLLAWRGLVLLLGAPQARADSKDESPNFYVETQFAFETAKSKLLLSNDTGTALRYGIGTYSGSEGQIGFQLMNDRDAITFALDNSSWAATWQDTSVRYFLGPFYLGALFTRAEIVAKNQGVVTIDAAGSGMGGQLGLVLAIGRSGSLHFDAATASVPSMKNSVAETVSIGQRLDLDVGAAIDITPRLLDFKFGYRIRTMSISSDTTYAESYYQTYLGLRSSFFF